MSRELSLNAIWRDPDLRESFIAGAVLCLAGLGLPLVYGLARVLWLGLMRQPDRVSGPLLVCGHRLDGTAISTDYRTRLDEAARLLAGDPELQLWLLGGGAPSEAAVGRDYLLARYDICPWRIRLEEDSLDSLENLRNARALLRDRDVVPTLLSSRYHLARLRVFGRQLALPHALHPAEPRRTDLFRRHRLMLLEAGYLCWFGAGKLYARVTRRRHLMARIQ